MDTMKPTNPATAAAVRLVVETPPGEWKAAIDAMTPQERQDLQDALDGMTERAVYLSRYLGPWAERQDAKAGQRAVRKVRRILGFSYPDSALSRFTP
jgi:hypothetical protein